jgi:hypothetical protein
LELPLDGNAVTWPKHQGHDLGRIGPAGAPAGQKLGLPGAAVGRIVEDVHDFLADAG